MPTRLALLLCLGDRAGEPPSRLREGNLSAVSVGRAKTFFAFSALLRDIKCIWCSVAGLWRGVVHVAKLSPSPLGEGLGWGLEVYAVPADPTPFPSPEGEG
jgi:hypothetical protein